MPFAQDDPGHVEEHNRLETLGDNLEAADVSLDGRLDTLEGTATSLDGRLDTIEGTATSLDGRLNTIETRVPSDPVLKTLYGPNSILAATADDSPATLGVPASTLVGRGASGGIAALTPIEVKSLLSLGSSGSTSVMRQYVGDASDGNVTFDGIVEVAGFTRSGSTYTITRDVYYGDATVNSGVTLNCRAFLFNCRGTLVNNGVMHWNGANGTSAAAGGNGTSGTIPGYGRAGGLGSITGTGSNGVAASPSLGGNGNYGGNAGANFAGTPGTTTAPGAGTVWKMLPYLALGSLFNGNTNVFNTMFGGAGGSGGAGDGTNRGGGGGGGGNPGVVNALAIVNNGTMCADGGNGGNSAGGNAAGGGGGGGGWLVVNTDTPVSGSGTIRANGGQPGAGTGTGQPGYVGYLGRVTQTAWAA